jgi:hypothetical protein
LALNIQIEKNFNRNNLENIIIDASLFTVGLLMNETIKEDFFSINRCLCDNFSFPLFVGVILLAVLFGFDIATTDLILLLGGYEQNPLMAFIIQYPILHIAIKGLVIIFITLVVQYSDYKVKGSGIWILLPVILLYSYVVYNNATVLQGLIQVQGIY